VKVTFPHMGTAWIPMRAILRDLDVEVVVPPPTTRRTVELGVRHSPEFACFPLKLNLGNFMEAYELGADTILMGGGTGPCRFGYYAQVHREILADLGYDFRMVVLEPPRGHIGELLEKLRFITGGQPLRRIWRALRLGWNKFQAIDTLEREVFRVRAREKIRGSASRTFQRGLEMIDEARNVEETWESVEKCLDLLARIPRDEDVEPLRVGVVGEIFMITEPAANLKVLERLGSMGVEVDRAVMIGEWIRQHLLLDALRLRRKKDPVKEAAKPYLDHFVGGEGLESIGNSVLYARRGYDGIVHILPFTCMPEIVARSLLPQVAADHDIPVLTLVLDEHAGEAGVLTRLEAFVDLLRRRKEQRRSCC